MSKYNLHLLKTIEFRTSVSNYCNGIINDEAITKELDKLFDCDKCSNDVKEIEVKEKEVVSTKKGKELSAPEFLELLEKAELKKDFIAIAEDHDIDLSKAKNNTERKKALQDFYDKKYFS